MYTPLGLPGDISYLFVIPLETSGPERLSYSGTRFKHFLDYFHVIASARRYGSAHAPVFRTCNKPIILT